MKNNIFKLVAKFTALATILSSVMAFSPALASALTTAKDTMTRVAISTTADHVVVFTLPSGTTFDQSGTTDTLRVDFPAAFTQGGTWVTGDFTVNDGTARTVNAVASGAATIDVSCTDGANNVGVAIDTTNLIFTIKPCGASFTASAATATVTFTIFGTTTTGTGTLTNPSSAGSASTVFAMCDEVASCTTSFTATHSVTVGLGIADSDQVSVTASVDPSLTFDIDTATTDTESAAPYSVPLGTLTTGAVASSSGTINSIWVDLATNASGGAVVTIQNANAANGLKSTSTPADDINNAAATMAAGTENYGLCVISVAQTSGTLSKAGTYTAGSCAASASNNDVKLLSTTPANILSTAGPLAGGRGRISVNAAISGVTPAHTDYADTLTIIATATF